MSEATATQSFSEQFYPYLHQAQSISPVAVLAEVKASALLKCRDVVALRSEVCERYSDSIYRCALAMAASWGAGGKLLSFGNGGSATDAQDIAVDCMLADLPALSLTNDAGIVTAVANDVGFENVFLRQVISLGSAGDIALGVSTSGNSHNVEGAFRTAQRMGLLTIGLAGTEGGATAALHRDGIVDYCFVVPSSYIPRIQEVHATIYHTLLALTHELLGSISPAGTKVISHEVCR